MLFSSQGFLTQNALQRNSNNIRELIKKPEDQAGNRMAREVWVEMSKGLGFAIDLLKSNVAYSSEIWSAKSKKIKIFSIRTYQYILLN